MMMAPALLLYLIVTWGTSITEPSRDNSSRGKLVFSHVLYRHGDRAPINMYPMDPYGAELWPQGIGELTTKGMMQHYLLGKYLRKRYSKLLSKWFSLTDIYVRATDKNRALQSAASNLAGLYPPVEGEIWNPNLDWQPIPIHTVPNGDDYLLVVDNPCPAYDKVFYKQSHFIIDAYNEQYADFFAYVRNQSGLTHLDFWTIGDIYDPLYCESAQGLKLPEWTQVVVNKTTGQTAYELIVDLKNVAKNLKYDSDEKAKLTGGYLLGDILSRLEKVADGNNSTADIEATKSIMYSAHDDTIMALLYAMNVVEYPFLVPYAAAVLIDLYTKDGKHYVEVSYKNNTPAVTDYGGKSTERKPVDDPDASGENYPSDSSEMLRFTIPGCPSVRCPLDTFIMSLKNRTSYPQSKRNVDCGITQGQLTPSHVQ